MHITVIRHSVHNWDMDKIVFDFLRDLKTRGHQITYWVNDFRPVFIPPQEVPVKKIPWPTPLGTILFALLHKFPTDVLLTDLLPLSLAASVQNRSRLVILAQVDNTILVRLPVMKAVMRGLNKLLMNRLGIPVIATSEGVKGDLKSYNPRKIITIPHRMNYDFYSRNYQTPYLVKKLRSFVILLYIQPGSLVEKNWAVRTLTCLKKIYPSDNYQIWLTGLEANELPGFPVTRFGPTKGNPVMHFKIFPEKDDFRDFLSAVDIILVPTVSQNANTLVFQAAACGAVIVATSNLPGFAHELNALLSRPADAEGLALNLRQVMTDSYLRRRLVRGGRRFVKQTIPPQTTERLEQFLMNISQKKSATMPPPKRVLRKIDNTLRKLILYR